MSPQWMVAATAARLGALDSYLGFEVLDGDSDGSDSGDGDGGENLAPGWVRLPVVESGGHLDAWLAARLIRHGRRNVAGSMVGIEVGHTVIGPTVSAIALDSRCPDPIAANLAVRPDADGYLEHLAVLGPVMAVLPDDPAASEPRTVVVADEQALVDWWAPRAAASLTPLLAAVRARAPFGLRGLWGGVADEVAGTALQVSQLAGHNPADGWRLAESLVDALDRHAPVRLPRGRPFPVSHPRGTTLFQVRGACCLYYRSAAIDSTCAPADRYCNTCPLIDDGSRQRRLYDHLVASGTADPVPA